MTRVHVCSTTGCPNLAPCPTHARPANAHWSTDRDGAAQNRFRARVLQRDGYQCTRCPATEGLVAHHIRPGYHTSDGITLCHDCHASVDSHARTPTPTPHTRNERASSSVRA